MQLRRTAPALEHRLCIAKLLVQWCAMSADDLRVRFGALRAWGVDGQRAPHKPLLALWAIGRCLRGEPRLAPFESVDVELSALLARFGPHRKAVHPQYPFWRMRKDGVWEIDRPELVDETSSRDATKASLIEHNIHGGLHAGDYDALRANPGLAVAIADSIVDAHFPESYRDDILEAVGIGESVGRPDPVLREELADVQGVYQTTRRQRHPGFRPAVLAVYGERCAVCGYGVRVADAPVTLDAAHIHWLRDAGPWQLDNGMALCVLHHRLFDRGAFALSADLRISVSNRVAGSGFEESLGRFHGELLAVIPKRVGDRPAPAYVEWHYREVFRLPQRA